LLKFEPVVPDWTVNELLHKIKKTSSLPYDLTFHI